MLNITTGELWSIIASITSILLGFFAIFLSVYFYISGRNTEKQVSSSLTKIETQSEMLQKLTGKQLDRLTRFVTEDRPHISGENVPSLLNMLSQLPLNITAAMQKVTTDDTQEELIDQLITSYIALYFYTAQTNYWSQYFLPGISEFDEANDSHVNARRMVDMSNADFEAIAKTLMNIDAKKIEANSIANLLTETRDGWQEYVRNASEVFIAREHENKQNKS